MCVRVLIICIYLDTRTHFHRRLRFLSLFRVVPDQAMLHTPPGPRGAGPLTELLAHLRRRRRGSRVIVLVGDGLRHQTKRGAPLESEEKGQAPPNGNQMSQKRQQKEVKTSRAKGVVSMA